MKKVGITGGIGSGKSLVCRIFFLQGIPVYNADEEAKKLMHTAEIKNELIESFGNIYNESGELDRASLAGKVFNNPDELQKLNSIVHPKVISHYRKWEAVQHAPFIVRESAILFESGTDKGLDKIITVTAPVELRIRRAIMRDHRSKEQIQAIISSQITDEEKVLKSDYVIINDEKSAVLPQIWALTRILSDGK
jgi:dephospho-CoA kinase